MQAARSRRERRDDGGKIEIIVAQCDIELVQNQHAEIRISHEFARFRPGAFGGGDIAGAVLRFPGETLAHRVPNELIAKARQCVAFGRMPGALDELHHADTLSAAEHAQRQSECRRRFALAGAGVDDQQSLLDRLGGDFGVLHGLALDHFGAMPLGFALIDRLAHTVTFIQRCYGAPFNASGSPATTSTTRSARAAIRWLTTPCMSRKRRPSGCSGTMPYPTSLATMTTGAAAAASAWSRRSISASISAPPSIRFESHSVRQSTNTGASQAACSEPARSRGASMVRHDAPRRARCTAMRSVISASPGSAVAT